MKSVAIAEVQDPSAIYEMSEFEWTPAELAVFERRGVPAQCLVRKNASLFPEEPNQRRHK